MLGVVERGGDVRAQVSTNVTGKSIIEFITDSVEFGESELITDEFSAYKLIGSRIPHRVIRHQERYADGMVHTNTIEGFWSLLKRAWYGSHHHYQKKFTPLYVIEACYKYNHRYVDDLFDRFLNGCFV